MSELIVGESLVSEFILAIPGIGVSIVDSSPREPNPDELARATVPSDWLAHTEELFYVFVSGVMVNSCTTTAFVKRYLTVSEVDVYNQRREAGSGQLVLSRAGGKDETGAGVPVVQCSRVTRLPQLGEGRGFASDRYIALAVQTLELQLDDEVRASHLPTFFLAPSRTLTRTLSFSLIDAHTFLLTHSHVSSAFTYFFHRLVRFR
jgi:hypothetical protein